jgi:hypothetical protein
MPTLNRLAASAAATNEDDDFLYHVEAFKRTLRTRNRSQLAIRTYEKALTQFFGFRTDTRRTGLVTALRRDDIGAWIEHLPGSRLPRHHTNLRWHHGA